MLNLFSGSILLYNKNEMNSPGPSNQSIIVCETRKLHFRLDKTKKQWQIHIFEKNKIK